MTEAHECPNCGFWCACEDYTLYGDCTHDCDAWKEKNPAPYSVRAEPDED